MYRHAIDVRNTAAEQSPLHPYPRSSGTAFAFDLDGTITKAELLPMIASELGLESEMRLLTELTMAGSIPFEDSFRLRFAILRSAGIDRIRSIVSEVEFDPDIEDFIRNNIDRCFVVTGNLDLWIQPLIERLGCKFYTSTATTDDEGRITGLDVVMRKNVAGLELKERFGRLVSIGDGFNDIPIFDVADIGVAFTGLHNAPDALVSVSNYVALNGKSLCRLLNTL
ncbi:HAD-IB family phosphatase [Agrobacterium larrymoorei]|uniref:phosphoserine phosphatase n=1 Tax=Agrobacterium larrymoorei TaxID=160699 RepID=A0A4D7DW30_9HYPH|nr:HAD family phosphatase [Agrobacterium larrymoorei]QCI98476.1 HAD family hydrolase [Agrobacterium larrymoorei]QYA06061.1 HAD family phosphatase [Agrobacterium larrymoorei]WHA40564.1 HAD family phosphatase [Agrobacterium larrymoorei]